MSTMFAKMIAFVRDEDGATAIEYGLIAALVSVAAIGALTAMGNSLGTMFNTVSSALSSAAGGGAKPAALWRRITPSRCGGDIGRFPSPRPHFPFFQPIFR